jgi:hypothetical protein
VGLTHARWSSGPVPADEAAAALSREDAAKAAAGAAVAAFWEVGSNFEHARETHHARAVTYTELIEDRVPRDKGGMRGLELSLVALAQQLGLSRGKYDKMVKAILALQWC